MNINSFILENPHLKITSDSRAADSNSIFFALRGSSSDGHKFIQDVYDRGCHHFVVEEESLVKSLSDVKYICVSSTRVAWASVWKQKFNEPDKSLFIVGITGTNGKTSISMMIEHILNSSKLPCGVMGTIDHHLQLKEYRKVWPTALTTPGPEILYPRLNEIKNLGGKALAIEISSHALDQKRAEGLELDAAVFSNLTEDHLDYHKNLEHYFKSKINLFEHLLKNSNKKNKVSVLNYSDLWIKKYLPTFGSVELLIEIKNLNLLNDQAYNKILDDFSIESRKTEEQSNIKLNFVQINENSLEGLQFSLVLDFKTNQSFKKLDFRMPLLGKFQAINWCQAVLSLQKMALTDLLLQEAALSFYGVPGRLQKVLNQKNKAVFIDYAHTPDALMRTLQSLRQVCHGKLIVVFGCGGDRDKTKRPLMGKVAEQFSDIQIVTNDNPRTEDPEKICQDILNGFSKKPYVELDRKRAITLAITQMTSVADVLLIAGKGHESYQILNDKTIDFSDYNVAEKIIMENDL